MAEMTIGVRVEEAELVTLLKQKLPKGIDSDSATYKRIEVTCSDPLKLFVLFDVEVLGG